LSNELNLFCFNNHPNTSLC